MTGVTPPGNAPTPWETAFEWVVMAEGGYVKDPNDPGGATNLGVSLRAVRLRDADKDGRLDFDLNHDGVVDDFDIRMITRTEAAQLYQADYWNMARCFEFPPEVGIALFDAAVLGGPRAAVALLQKSLKVNPDGRVGPATIGASKGRPARQIVARFMAERTGFYAGLKQAPHFMTGWAKRLFQLDQFLFLDYPFTTREELRAWSGAK